MSRTKVLKVHFLDLAHALCGVCVHLSVLLNT